MFPGSNEADELRLIFKALGTPTEKTWPEVVDLPDWKYVKSLIFFWSYTNNCYRKYSFTNYSPKKLTELVPGLDEDGYDLLNVCFSYLFDFI